MYELLCMLRELRVPSVEIFYRVITCENRDVVSLYDISSAASREHHMSKPSHCIELLPLTYIELHLIRTSRGRTSNVTVPTYT